jgi:hypothetical protein
MPKGHAHHTKGFHILREAEGGPGYKSYLSMLKRLGIDARKHTSCFLGHDCIFVTGTKKQIAQADRLINEI